MTKISQKSVEAPHSRESEMMVLGCMISKINDLRIGSESLQPEDFYIDSHKIIFRIMKRLFRKDSPADIVLVAEELKNTNELDQVGGFGYLTTLAQFAGVSAYIEEYVKLVKDKSLLRNMIFSCKEIQEKALKLPADVRAFASYAINLMEEIESDYPSDSTPSISEIILGLETPDEGKYLEKIAHRRDYYSEFQKPFPIGIPTNYSQVDGEDFILRPGNLVIIAGRPAMGKTAFALNIMHNVCSQGVGVGLMSLEMDSNQILERLVSLETSIPAKLLESGNISDAQYKLLDAKLSFLMKKRIHIADKGISNITQLSAKARLLYEKKKIDILIVDYLQLIGASRKKDHRHYEVRYNRKLCLRKKERTLWKL